MNVYAESELQSYVERHIEQDFVKWLSVPRTDTFRFRMLGAQVPCANGIIDLLGVAGHTPVIVELKAELATEKVTGQVLRYKAAVQDTFESQVHNLLYTTYRDSDITTWDELKPICVVIAPAYHDKAVAGLAAFGWLLEARYLDNGDFSITSHKAVRKHYRFVQPKLAKLMQPIATEYLGWRVGVTIAGNHQRLLRDPLSFEK